MHWSRPAYAVLAGLDAALAAGERDRRLTKPLLMPLLAVQRDAPTRLALALGGAGDTALLGRSGTAFRAGLGAFLLGHAAWARALRARPGTGLLRRHPALALPYAALLAGSVTALWPRAGRDRVVVAVYGSALTATALAALDTGDRRAAAGGALFLLSDGLLALERFGDVHLPAHEALVMLGYTSAQALLAAGGSTTTPPLS